MAVDTTYRPFKFQQAALDTPADVDILLGGGRGPGKSEAALLLLVQHCQQYKDAARCIVHRTTFGALRPLFDRLLALSARLGMVVASSNANEFTLRYANGATARFIPWDGDAKGWDDRVVGDSATFLLFDEVGVLATPEIIDKMRSLLRGGVPTRVVQCANAARASNAWLRRRYINTAERVGYGKVFRCEETGRPSVVIKATYLDNPSLNHTAYAANLRLATRGDAALTRAWLDGDLDVSINSAFGENLTPEVFVDWPRLQHLDLSNLPVTLEAHVDHGAQNPFAAVVSAVWREQGTGPDGRLYARGSRVIVAEASSVWRDFTGFDPVVVPDICAALLNLQERAAQRFPITVDAAIWAQHGTSTIASEYERYLMQRVYPSTKGSRALGWSQINNRLAAARADPPVAALYLTQHVPLLRQALQVLTRDPTDPDDIDLRGSAGIFGHVADALRYSVFDAPKHSATRGRATLGINEAGQQVVVISEEIGVPDLMSHVRQAQQMARRVGEAVSLTHFAHSRGKRHTWQNNDLKR